MLINIKDKNGTVIIEREELSLFYTNISNVTQNQKPQSKLYTGNVYTDKSGLHFQVSQYIEGKYIGTVYFGYEVSILKGQPDRHQ